MLTGSVKGAEIVVLGANLVALRIIAANIYAEIIEETRWNGVDPLDEQQAKLYERKLTEAYKDLTAEDENRWATGVVENGDSIELVLRETITSYVHELMKGRGVFIEQTEELKKCVESLAKSWNIDL